MSRLHGAGQQLAFTCGAGCSDAQVRNGAGFVSSRNTREL